MTPSVLFLAALGLALAGRAGARLAAGLGLPTGCRSTLLRMIHRLPTRRSASWPCSGWTRDLRAPLHRS